MFSRAKLVEFLLRELNFGKIQPGDTYKAFCDLFTGTICTTNFDSLLEDTLTLLHQPVSVVATKDRLTIGDRNERKIIKLHGDFNHPDKMVITERDYDTYIDSNPIFATYIANLFITNTMLLIGYSLDDDDFRSIWQIIYSRLSNMAQPAYCVAVNASEEKIARYKRRNIRIINLKGDKKQYKTILRDFFIEIKDYVSNEMDRKVQSVDERINEQMIIPAEDNRLCFISCSMSRISQLSAMLYPVLQNLGITAVRIDNMLMPEDNWIDVSSVVIRKSKAAIIDISDGSPNVMLEMGLINAEKGLNNTLIICEKGTLLPISVDKDSVLMYSFSDSYENENSFRKGIEKWCEKVFHLSNKEYASTNSNVLFDDAHRLIEKGEFSASIISACSELEYWYYLNHETGSRIIPFNQIFVEYYDGERKQAVKDIELRNRIVHRHYRANKKEATDFLKSVERIHRNFSK